MRHLTRPQRVVLLAFLVLAVNGLLRSPAFNEPIEEEKMPNVDNGTIAVTCSEQNPASLYVPVGELEAFQRDAALWRGHAWRAEVAAIVERAARFQPQQTTQKSWLLGRAVVRASRELQLPLGIVAAMVECESEFKWNARGSQGEAGPLQVYPIKDRPMKEIRQDLFLAVRWPLEHCFAPIYHSNGLNAALLHYNNQSKQYVRDVLNCKEQNYSESFWDGIPK